MGIKCHLNITPNKECYEVCVQSKWCGVLKAWKREIKQMKQMTNKQAINELKDWQTAFSRMDKDMSYAIEAFDVAIKALNCSEESNRSEPLTDREQRIFLSAMSREEKICKEVDEECWDCREPHEDSLVKTCHEITRKVKGALWT